MSSAQQYCLRWNNHQSNLLRVFTRLLGSELFTDVLLAAEGCTIRAHKVVLSACSTYFENLFMTFNEKNQIVILKDTRYEDVAAIVEFMYKGEINVAQEQLPSLIRTAENLKVKGLAEVSTSPAEKEEEPAPTPQRPNNSGDNSTNNNNAEYSGNSSNKKHSDSGKGVIETKRKRGRPRTLDSPGEVPDPCFVAPKSAEEVRGRSSPLPSSSKLPRVVATASVKDIGGSISFTPLSDVANSSASEANGGDATLGGPLTNERIQELGIIKLNDYLTHGTRQQFWEEYFVKVVMQAVRNKEIDMKTSAELLGVSYGTLYGRYREVFGYLKHGWNNIPGRPGKFYQDKVMESFREGKVSMKTAALALNVDPTIVAYQLSRQNEDSRFYVDEDSGDEVTADTVIEIDRDDEGHLDQRSPPRGREFVKIEDNTQ